MNAEQASGFIIVSLAAIVGFMLRHYFLRIEGHLKKHHELISVITNHELRIERVERHLKIPPLPKAMHARATEDD